MIWKLSKFLNWTGYKKVDIYIYRLDWTKKGIFGHLHTSNGFDCVTLERKDTLIPAGRYKAGFYSSPSFKRTVLLLEDVPDRTFIEIHPADYEYQLEGCIALASRRIGIENLDADSFAADLNKATFDKFMEVLKGADDIWVTVK